MSTPSPSPRRIDDPALLPFLPALYVAWADGDLTDEEIDDLARRCGPECPTPLAAWLDPASPPTALELGRMLTTLRRGIGSLAERPEGLAEWGLRLAEDADRPVVEAERQALRDLEAALGVGGRGGARLVLAARPVDEGAPLPEPSFDPSALEAAVHDPAHRDLRRRILEELSRPEAVAPDGASRRELREWVLGRCRRLAEEGWGRLAFPRDLGGADDLGAFVVAFETLAFGDLSVLVKYGVQFGLWGGAVLNLGDDAQRRELLPAIGSLELPGCFAMSETGHGSNVQELETTATWIPARGEIEIRSPSEAARKDYIGNAALHGRAAAVFARLIVGDEDHGVHALVVPIRDETGAPVQGVEIGDCGGKMGLEGVDNGRLRFDGVRVPRTALLGRFASIDEDGRYTSPIASPSKRFFTMLGTLVGGRVAVACGALSAAKTGLAIAVRYGARRRQFGPAGAPEHVLFDYPSHRRRLLPRLARTWALHFALADLRTRFAARSEDEGERRALESRAAGLKAISTEHTIDVLQAAREACGGQGYLAVNRFAALRADTDVFATFEGDNTVLLQLVAKSVLTGWRRELHHLGPVGLIRTLGREALRTLAELNPVVTRRTDPDHLRDPEVLEAALAWREDHLLIALARRLKKRIDDGADPFAALVDCQTHALSLARAHVEQNVFAAFRAGVESIEDTTFRPVLARLLALHGLARLEADRGWFLAHHYMDPPKAKAVREQVDALAAEIRPDAVPLVDAFGIPDAVLRAPIALGDVPA